MVSGSLKLFFNLLVIRVA